ncbi:MAG: hypothetical protein QXH37_02855 [Candidatus Bathyarchaeia archaeon]
MSRTYEKTLERLKVLVQETFKEMPEDVKNLKTLTGAFGYRAAPTILAMEESRAVADELWYLRELCKKESVGLDCLKEAAKVILELRSLRFEGWYKMKSTANLLRDSAKALAESTDKTEYKNLLEQLMLYIGKQNVWIETMVPWDALSKAFEKAR